MVLLDLNLIQNQGLSSRQASLVGAGDFFKINKNSLSRQKSKLKNQKKSKSRNTSIHSTNSTHLPRERNLLGSAGKKSVSFGQDSDEEEDFNTFEHNQQAKLRRNNSSSNSTEVFGDENEDNSISKAVIKASHLYLQDKNITKISPQISKLKNLKVLYLYDNRISDCSSLAYARNLTHLYLMNNKLTTTKGLSKLRKLEKLYLAGNQIEIVEDLVTTPLDNDFNAALKELHLENQVLPKGHSLIFDPDTLNNLAYSLQVLNISHNNLSSIDNLICLLHKSLTKLIANDNNIKKLNTRDLDFPHLTNVCMKNNPIQKKSGSKLYRQKLVVKFRNLDILDDFEISNFERKWHESFFMKEQTLKQRKEQAQAEQSIQEETPLHNTYEEPKFHHANAFKLPKAYSSIGEKLAEKYQKSRSKFGSKSESVLNKNNSGDHSFSENLGSLSTTQIAPPVPDHWNRKGLPGGRNQFDKILEKARSHHAYNAAKSEQERLQQQELLYQRKMQKLQENSQHRGNRARLPSIHKHPTAKTAGDFGMGDDFQRKIDISQDFTGDHEMEGSVVNKLGENPPPPTGENRPKKVINLSAMRLAPLDD